jgi:hypothetical protein
MAYAPMHEKDLPNRSHRRRMGSYRAPRSGPQQARTIEDLTKIVDPGPSMSFRCGHVRLDIVPFGVGVIRRVRFSHAC